MRKPNECYTETPYLCNFLVNLKGFQNKHRGKKWGYFSTVILVSKAGRGAQTLRYAFQDENPSSPDLDSNLRQII